MAMTCSKCNHPLDKSNPAEIRCVNINCDQIKLCHCCGEKLTSKISKIECYVCKEMHCLYCDKDSFRFDVRWKEKQICEHCFENNPHVDTDDMSGDNGFTIYESMEEALEGIEIQCMNEDLEEECEGILARLSDGGFICPICDEVSSESDVFGYYYG